MSTKLGDIATYDPEENLEKRTDQYEDHPLPKNIGKKKKRMTPSQRRQGQLSKIMKGLKNGRK